VLTQNGVLPPRRTSQRGHAHLDFSPRLLNCVGPTVGSEVVRHPRPHRSLSLVTLLETAGRFLPQLFCFVPPDMGETECPMRACRKKDP